MQRRLSGKIVLFGQFFLPKNIKTALYQKRTLCNRDRAKPYPCYQNIKTALYQKRGLDLGGTIYGGKSVSQKRFAL